VEELVLVLFAVILVMGGFLGWLRGRAAAQGAGGRKPRGAHGARRAPSGARNLNYSLAPRKPEVMAGMLFELLATRLNFEEMLSFADLISTPATTTRYLERLAARTDLAEFTGQLEFLCHAMEAHGYSDNERIQVSQSLAARARQERKLLTIHKNVDKIF